MVGVGVDTDESSTVANEDWLDSEDEDIELSTLAAVLRDREDT